MAVWIFFSAALTAQNSPESKIHIKNVAQDNSAYYSMNYTHLVWSASIHLTEYSLVSFFILTLVCTRTQVASNKRPVEYRVRRVLNGQKKKSVE
jgi:hypothetical protein